MMLKNNFQPSTVFFKLLCGISLFCGSSFAFAETVVQKSHLQKSVDSSKPTISIIIDDIGNNKKLGLRAARLSSKVALSILPYTPFSVEIANYAHQHGKDLLLHQPMESFANKHLLGPGALLESMDKNKFAMTLENTLHAVPHIIGINNHMGSLLTIDTEKMNWVMSELKPHGYFFIDSRTTSKSVASNVSELWQIPHQTRQIFLDHADNKKDIEIQFNKLIHQAKLHGHALAIGHPRKNTLSFLEQHLPKLKNYGIKLIKISSLMDSSNSEPSILRNCELENNPAFNHTVIQTIVSNDFCQTD